MILQVFHHASLPVGFPLTSYYYCSSKLQPQIECLFMLWRAGPNVGKLHCLLLYASLASCDSQILDDKILVIVPIHSCYSENGSTGKKRFEPGSLRLKLAKYRNWGPTAGKKKTSSLPLSERERAGPTQRRAAFARRSLLLLKGLVPWAVEIVLPLGGSHSCPPFPSRHLPASTSSEVKCQPPPVCVSPREAERQDATGRSLPFWSWRPRLEGEHAYTGLQC